MSGIKWSELVRRPCFYILALAVLIMGAEQTPGLIPSGSMLEHLLSWMWRCMTIAATLFPGIGGVLFPGKQEPAKLEIPK